MGALLQRSVSDPDPGGEKLRNKTENYPYTGTVYKSEKKTQKLKMQLLF